MIKQNELKDAVNIYTESRKKQFSFSSFGGFFAFGDDQFDQNKIGNAPFVHLGMGLYSSKSNAKELIEAFKSFSKNKDNFLREHCNPYGVFAYEFGNHECSYTGDHDEPYEITKSIYGEEIARNILNDKEFIKTLYGDDNE
jgi:hypothetical protein